MSGDGKTLFDDGFKVCRVCGERKPAEEFYVHKDKRNKRGYTLSPRCKPCEREKQKLLRFGGGASKQQLLFGYEHNSAKDKASPEERRRIFAREIAYHQDIEALERWAAHGFVSDYPVLDAA